MTSILWCVLGAALLHLVCAVLAKAGGKGFDNGNPRAWLASQQGWRARAHAAQQNSLEAQPFFFAAVLLALHTGAPLERLQSLLIAWLLIRLAYIWFYVRDRATLRSLSWIMALGVNIAILFSGTVR